MVVLWVEGDGGDWVSFSEVIGLWLLVDGLILFSFFRIFWGEEEIG